MHRTSVMNVLLPVLLTGVLAGTPAQAETRPPPEGAVQYGGFKDHYTLPPEELIKVALRHAEKGNMDLAVNVLVNGVGQYPDSARLNSVAGALLLSQGDVDRALRYLEQAVQLNPASVEDRVNRAQAYLKFGRQEEALADLNEAVRLDGTSLAARFNRGTLLFNQGQAEAALADFKACTELDPKAAPPWFNVAAVHQVLGHTDEAVSAMQQFITLSDNPAWKQQGEALVAQWTSAGEATQ